ncbi:MAG: hypothetical protein D6730_09695 [Bacteroidetes bacterium]|nr:MAG: hypothetical protein D6730_09695 [Bacteroidota bacterium]
MWNRKNPKATPFQKGYVRRNSEPSATDAPKSHPLFPLAVVIMGIVSCYTTALGLEPMLNNLLLSYAMAFALSIFMVAIALQFPRSYQNGTQNRLILGYSMVAIFSVLLNFNAIYGIFSAEKLLYNELKDNRQRLMALQVQAEESLDRYFGAQQTEAELQKAQALLEEEKTNPRDFGYGTKARRINKEAVIPLEAKLSAIKAKYDPLLKEIGETTSQAVATIDAALEQGEVAAYRKAVDVSIDAYTTVAAKTANMIADGSFTYQPLEFQHRDVGHLNHSLWSLLHPGSMDGKQLSALLVSLLLAILIDFIVLFVLVLLHKPSKKERLEEEAQQNEPQRASFKQKTSPASLVAAPERNIYAKRANRKQGTQTATAETTEEAATRDATAENMRFGSPHVQQVKLNGKHF